MLLAEPHNSKALTGDLRHLRRLPGRRSFARERPFAGSISRRESPARHAESTIYPDGLTAVIGREIIDPTWRSNLRSASGVASAPRVFAVDRLPVLTRPASP